MRVRGGTAEGTCDLVDSLSRGGRFAAQRDLDVAIIGFGFAGLATLAHLVRGSTAPLSVAIVAPDGSGQGLAYRTRDPGHLLNVPAGRMGAWAHATGDFADWLQTAEGERACGQFGLAQPGPEDFAPRALYARYLDAVRTEVLRGAERRSIRVQWLDGVATSLARDGAAWSLRAGNVTLRARSCVLATGNEPQSAFAGLDHDDLHDGPWDLTAEQVAAWSGRPVALVGAGLTAVDAVLSLRRLGFEDEIVALSRNGLLPRAHRRDVAPFSFTEETLRSLTTLPAIVRAIADAEMEGHDWRAVIDALRPHTTTLWLRLSQEDQCQATARWAPIWNVHRHRMAPEIAAQLRCQRNAGTLRVAATRRLSPTVTPAGLELSFERHDGEVDVLRPAAVIDCSGGQLDWSRSRQPLLRGLLAGGACTRHKTGLGVSADAGLRAGEGLFAIGRALTGQLWETGAVPELRAQAATIADGLLRDRVGPRPDIRTAASPSP